MAFIHLFDDTPENMKALHTNYEGKDVLAILIHERARHTDAARRDARASLIANYYAYEPHPLKGHSLPFGVEVATPTSPPPIRAPPAASPRSRIPRASSLGSSTKAKAKESDLSGGGRFLGVGFCLHPDVEYLALARPILEEEADFFEVNPETMWRKESGRLVRNDFHGLFQQIRERSGRPFVAHGLGFRWERRSRRIAREPTRGSNGCATTSAPSASSG